jgi:phosphatidylserine decarboxylase
MNKPRIPVALEGYPFIAFGGLTSVVLAILRLDLLALGALAITAFVLYFFRDPERIAPQDRDAIVSPADGKVILVDKVFDDRFVKEQVYKISIFMNVFNVHVNRVPINGTVEQISYRPGLFYSANTERGALENEYCALTLATDSNRRYAMVQIAGLIARRIVCWATPGDSLVKGERFGLIRFGSRVDLYLPLQTQLEISVGQQVRAGETTLGYLA